MNSNLRYEPSVVASRPLSFAYTMGWSGNVNAVALNNTLDVRTFSYHLADRLTSMTPSHGAVSPSYVFGYTGLAAVQANVLSGTNWVPAYAFGQDQQRSVSAVGQYNAAGTQISTTVCLVHDALGRLTAVGLAKAVLPGPGAIDCQSESDVMSTTVRFEYDAMNRRVARQDGPIWTEYVHDPGGNLLAELTRPAISGGTWTTNREYAWLDGQPLAQLEYLQSRAAPYLYYFHLDHLGQPRALTNETGSTTVWSAIPARPYGDVAEATTQDPLNGKTVVTNLRLPGQYDERLFTAAGLTGLQGPYYNWNRWYLPTLGRYMELDPIAVAGGFNGPWGPNWYGYALQNPNRWIDRMGLEYNDIGVQFGLLGFSLTVGWQWGSQGVAGYYGFGFGTPGLSVSFTGSADYISPGVNTSLQLGFGGGYQTGMGPDGKRYHEFGASWPGIAYYPYLNVIPGPPPARPSKPPCP